VDEGQVDVGASLVAGDQPPEAQEPRVGALDDAAVPVAPQLPPVLSVALPGAQVQREQVNPALLQSLPARAGVVAPVHREAPPRHAQSATQSRPLRGLRFRFGSSGAIRAHRPSVMNACILAVLYRSTGHARDSPARRRSPF